MNNEKAVGTLEGVEIVWRNGVPTGLQDRVKTASPFATLAALKLPVAEGSEVAPEAPATAVEPASTNEGEGTMVTETPVVESTAATPTEALAAEAPSVAAEESERERTPEENAALVRELQGLEGTAGEAGSETEQPRERGRRRNRRGKPQGEGRLRTPHLGGIRKIELVQVAPPASPPRGSIGLFKFLNISGAAHLARCAAEVVAKGGTPDVVVWSKSDSRFDLVRIMVMTYEGRDRNEERVQLARLEISEATGKYGNLARYVGKKLYPAEVLGKRDSIPSERVDATKALNEVLLEANQRLVEADAKKRVPQAPAEKQEVQQ